MRGPKSLARSMNATCCRDASDLTDGEWKVLEPLLPRAKALGRLGQGIGILLRGGERDRST